MSYLYHGSLNRRFLINQFPNEWQRFINNENDGWGFRVYIRMCDDALGLHPLSAMKDIIGKVVLLAKGNTPQPHPIS